MEPSDLPPVGPEVDGQKQFVASTSSLFVGADLEAVDDRLIGENPGNG